jgi:ABC-type phosphate transport system substrate-binding protein
VDAGYPPAWLEEHNVIQLPVVGQPVVMGYNLGAYAPSGNQTLVFSMPVLANIWSGNIVYWNDSAIVQLNPDLSLPHEPIVLVFANESRASISDAFANALADFNPAFNLSVTTNDSFAGRWSTYGTNAGRSFAVAPGEQQLGYVLVIIHLDDGCPLIKILLSLVNSLGHMSDMITFSFSQLFLYGVLQHVRRTFRTA